MVAIIRLMSYVLILAAALAVSFSEEVALAVPPDGIRVQVVQIQASGQGQPKQVPRELKALSSTLKKFSYRTFKVASEADRAAEFGADLQFDLVSGDVLTLSVHSAGDDTLHVQAVVSRGPKTRARANFAVRSGKTTLIGQDLGEKGDGLFVAVTVKRD